MLSPGPTEQIGNAIPTSAGRSVASAFEWVASQFAPAVAAVEGDRSLTYSTLYARSGAVAGALLARGLAPGGRVMVALPRGLDYLSAVVGIVRAGGVYVPVDPRWPRARLDELAAIVNPALTIGSGGVSADELIDESPGVFETPDIGPDSPCYIMFTSGTTGEPKGVEVPHRAVVRLVVGQDAFELGPERAWLHVSAVSFDASTLEIWGPLLNGGRCVTVPEELPSIHQLSEILRSSGATDAWLTASLFNAMIDDAPGAFAGMQQVMTGGERVSPEHARKFLERWPGVRLINGYGPTENTTFTCCHTITMEDTDNPAGVPIGRAIRGTDVLIVDEDDRPADEGELLAGGAGVALGYVGDEALTRTRFVEIGGVRWYRTGDLARRRDDGVIEFLGRRDRQVKIRGHRIELGEVEAQIAAHEGVGRVFAMTIGDRADINRLAAAYSCGGERVEPEDLRAWLSGRVPKHLIPDVLYALDEIPIGRTGKVDLDAVRQQVEASIGVSSETASLADENEPDSPDEIGWGVLAGMLEEILPDSNPRPWSSFLEIGGHSIAALRLAARLNASRGVAVPIGDIIGCESLGALAEVIGDAAHTATTSRDDDPEPDENPDEVRASSIQEQFYFEQALDPTGSAYHEFAGFRAGPGLDIDALERAWRALIARHEILRTRLVLRDDYLVQHIDPPGSAQSAGFDVHPLIGWDENAAAVVDVLTQPFDLERDLPTRLHVFRLSDGGHAVVFTFHHMVVDEWSMDLIRDELGALYRGESPPPPVPYRVYSGHESRERRDEEIVKVASRLLAVPPGPGPLGRSPAPAVCRDVLDGLTVDRLGALAREADSTPSAYLLAVYGGAIREVFNRHDAAIITPLSQRTTPRLQRVIGCCNTMHPVIVSDSDPVCTAREVQSDLAGAYSRPVVPFVDVIRATQRLLPGRGFAVEFGFAYETAGAFTPDLGPVRTGPLRCPKPPARFPVALLLRREGEHVRGSLVASAGGEGAALLHDLGEMLERRILGRAEPKRIIKPSGGVQPESLLRVSDRDESLRYEAAVAWESVLGSPPSGNDENFFDRGGHSLLLLRLISKIRAATGVEIQMGPFLERPVFGRLVWCLGEANRADERAGRTFRVVELREGPRTIIALPGAIGRPILYSRLAREMTANDPDAPGLLAYDLCEPIERLGPIAGLERVLARLLGDMHRPDVCGIIGFSVGGLLPMYLAELPPEIERRVHLWLVDVYHPDAFRGSEARVIASVGNALRHPLRVPLAAVDSARITRRLLKKNIDKGGELGLDMPAVERLRDELHRHQIRPWHGSATIFVAGRKPIWQPHFDEREINGMGPLLTGETRRVIIPHLHQDIPMRGARRIARVISDDLARKDTP